MLPSRTLGSGAPAHYIVQLIGADIRKNNTAGPYKIIQIVIGQVIKNIFMVFNLLFRVVMKNGHDPALFVKDICYVFLMLFCRDVNGYSANFEKDIFFNPLSSIR
jgi:hypothetical protein